MDSAHFYQGLTKSFVSPDMSEHMSGQCPVVKNLIYSFQASKEVLDEATAQLWWAGKELTRDKSLGDFIGKNEKTKIIAKLQKASCL